MHKLYMKLTFSLSSIDWLVSSRSHVTRTIDVDCISMDWNWQFHIDYASINGQKLSLISLYWSIVPLAIHYTVIDILCIQYIINEFSMIRQMWEIIIQTDDWMMVDTLTGTHTQATEVILYLKPSVFVFSFFSLFDF